jgi:hypothetical protein
VDPEATFFVLLENLLDYGKDTGVEGSMDPSALLGSQKKSGDQKVIGEEQGENEKKGGKGEEGGRREGEEGEGRGRKE